MILSIDPAFCFHYRRPLLSIFVRQHIWIHVHDLSGRQVVHMALFLKLHEHLLALSSADILEGM
jgi:hypothetical protein